MRPPPEPHPQPRRRRSPPAGRRCPGARAAPSWRYRRRSRRVLRLRPHRPAGTGTARVRRAVRGSSSRLLPHPPDLVLGRPGSRRRPPRVCGAPMLPRPHRRLVRVPRRGRPGGPVPRAPSRRAAPPLVVSAASRRGPVVCARSHRRRHRRRHPGPCRAAPPVRWVVNRPRSLCRVRCRRPRRLPRSVRPPGRPRTRRPAGRSPVAPVAPRPRTGSLGRRGVPRARWRLRRPRRHPRGPRGVTVA